MKLGVRSQAFVALCERDLWVTVRHEPVGFLAQSLLQPLFFLFVFGRVLPEIGQARGAYGAQLMPGVIALTVVLTALQNTALPLVIEFSFTKEIEDRLLAPLATWAVAIQKMVIAAFRGMISGVLILPLASVVLPGGINLGGASVGAFVVILVLGALAGAAMGLVLGTAVPPNRISVAFAIVLTPLIFTGATFYPWASLARLQWFQIVTLFNPLTYVSEGMRASLTTLPHLRAGWIGVGVVVALAIFTLLGVRGFVRRAVD
ncbi:MAG TPA: ABC transporter permease [Solirubrobacteraceae bacterium]|jgi:ABC-2 type transport system permease protein|nr:ABC transporter permease [Solirubrobacteraceae bacterium]